MSKKSAVFEQLKEAKTMSQLIKLLPFETIEWSATGILIFFCCIPLLTFFNALTSALSCMSYWFSSNLFAGFFGWMITGIYVYKRYQEKTLSLRKYLNKHPLVLGLGLLLIWSIISTLLSNHKTLSFFGEAYAKDGLIAYFSYAGIFVTTLCISKQKRFRLILEMLTGVSTFLAFFTFLNSEILNTIVHMDATRSIFENPNHYGYYLCITLLCTITLFVTDQKNNNSIKNTLLFLYRIVQIMLITNSLELCYTFGASLAVIGGVLGFLVLFWKVDKKRWMRLFFAVGLLFFVLLYFHTGTWNILDDFGTLNHDVNNIISNSEDAYHAGTGRWILWKTALKFACDKPIFGYGPDNLTYLYHNLDMMHSKPHNEMIQMAACLGFPAVLFYLYALAGLLVGFIKKYRNINMETLGIFCAVGGYLISSLFGVTFFYTTPFFYLILGIAGRSLDLLDKQANQVQD